MKKFLVIMMLFASLLLVVSCGKEDKTTSEATTEDKFDPTKDYLPPLIKGVFTTEIEVGTPFDPMAGITAEDDFDGDVTDKIKVEGTVDVNVPGQYKLTYKVSDKAGNEAVVDRIIIVKDGQLLINPKFDDGLNGWGLWSGEGGEATVEVVDGEAKIVITAIGSANWHVQFEQKNLTIEAGKKYQISFEARAEEPRSIEVLMEDPENNYHKYGTAVINLTTEMKTYTLNIVVDTGTISTAKLGFMLGKVDANSIPTVVYLDNFTMVEVEEIEDTTPPKIHGAEYITIDLGSNWDPLKGLSVSDDLDKELTVDDIVVVSDNVDTSIEGTYEVVYSLTDSAGNKTEITRKVTVKDLNYEDTEEIVNGDFSEDESITDDHDNETGWREWHHNEGQKVNYQIVDGVLEVEIQDIGWTVGSWSIQLQQTGIHLEQGVTYKLVFDAKSTEARSIVVVFKTTSEQLYVEKSVDIGTEMDTYEIVFTVENNTDENMVLSISMGKIDDNTPISATLTFDNFILYRVVE